jgi:hypothetical protein
MEHTEFKCLENASSIGSSKPLGWSSSHHFDKLVDIALRYSKERYCGPL